MVGVALCIEARGGPQLRVINFETPDAETSLSKQLSLRKEGFDFCAQDCRRRRRRGCLCVGGNAERVDGYESRQQSVRQRLRKVYCTTSVLASEKAASQ